MGLKEIDLKTKSKEMSKAVKTFFDDLQKKKDKTENEKKKLELIRKVMSVNVKLLKADLTIPKLTQILDRHEEEEFNRIVEENVAIDRRIDKLNFDEKLEKMYNPDRAIHKKKSIRDKHVKKSKFAFKGLITETDISQIHGNKTKTVQQYMNKVQRAKDSINKLLKVRLKKYGGLKVVLKTEVRFSRERPVKDADGNNVMVKNSDGHDVILKKTVYTDSPDVNGEVTANPWFYSYVEIFMKNDTELEIKELLRNMVVVMQEKIDTFVENGSDWVVDEVLRVSITTNAYQPLKGGKWRPLPKCYSSQSCLNVKNFDERTGEQYNDCFEIAILAFLHPAKANHHRYSHYKPFKGTLDMTGLSNPVKIEKSSLHKFELNNNLQINIFEVGTTTNKKGKEIVSVLPLYISPRKLQLEKDRQVDLLWIEGDLDDDEDEDGSEASSHFALCRNFNGMMSKMVEGNHGKFFCKRCLTHFDQQGLLDQHMMNRVCLDHEAIKTILPKEGENTFEFKNFKRQQQNPFRIYADFESNVVEILDLNEKSKTQTVAIQQNISYGLLLKSSVPKYSKPYEMRRRSHTDTDEDWAGAFLSKLDEYEEYVFDLLKVNEKIRLTKEDEIAFMVETHCHICEKEIFGGKGEKVRDHDHLTGEYRGAAHNSCNLNYNHKNFKIPVIFHNLKGYDGHFIIQAIAAEAKKRRITVVAQNSEKFMCMTIGRFRFIDSLAFLTSSLENLVQSLGDNISFFPNLSKNFPEINDRQKDLLIRKGVYPYEYMDSLHRFDETSLPPIDKFYSSLAQKSISEENYEFARQVWKEFGCKNLGDYHDLYLKSDVLLLTDVFESFIELCLREYKLDPTHYVSLPSFSIDAGMKFTGAKVELYHQGQEDMYAMVEKGIRGGISVISKRSAEANNKYMKNYNPEIESSFIIYLDANNLYAHALKQYLPVGNHHWENPEDWDEKKILAMTDKQQTGAIFECDIEYPESLHDKHNDYPFLAEKRKIQFHELSQIQQSMIREKNFILTEKLVPNLNDKEKYIVHYRTLKQALQNGLKLKKIHRVLSFNQSSWLESYIDHNTELRSKKGITDFQKDFFKLLNNSVYGKTLENVRGRIDYKIVTNSKSARKYISRPTFKTSNIIADEVVGIEMRKQKVVLDKPIFAGFAVLETSKELMYDFHYNTIKKRYGEKAKLLMTDTDSLEYHIHTEDLYKDMSEDLSRYDTSAYPKDHPIFSEKNKKVVGKFKDESNGMIIESFVGLRSKMYSNQMNRPEIDLDKNDKVIRHQKGKGLPGSVMSKSIDHSTYKQCIMNPEFKHEVEFSSLRSINHRVYTLNQRKTGLSSFDDKRYILPDGISTRAHGHWRNYEDLRHIVE